MPLDPAATYTEKLISFGTLLDPKVQQALFRREGDAVTGCLLALTSAELATADAYETADYARRRVTTRGGGQAWCYVSADPLVVAERIALIGDSIAYGRTTPDGGWAALIAAGINDILRATSCTGEVVGKGLVDLLDEFATVAGDPHIHRDHPRRFGGTESCGMGELGAARHRCHRTWSRPHPSRT